MTARKREERLQDVPISITAFSSEDLTQRNVTRFSDVANYTPNLNINSGSGTYTSPSTPTIFIRGVGQGDPSISADPGVALYVDGVYAARALGAVMDLPDVQSVQVLRGPQGDLFGKNAVGGALVIETTRPGDTFKGMADFTYGSYNLIKLRGMVAGPLSETVGVKLAASYSDQDGFGDLRPFPALGVAGKKGAFGAREDFSLRGGLQFKAGDSTTIYVQGDYSKTNGSNNVSQVQFVPPTGALVAVWNGLVGNPATGGTPWGPNVLSNLKFDSYASGPNRADQRVYGASVTIDSDLGGVDVKSITAYRNSKVGVGRDSDGSPLAFLFQTSDILQKQFTQELQFSGKAFDDKLEWFVGGFYLWERAEQRDNLYTLPGVYPALRALPGAFFPAAPAPGGIVPPGFTACAPGTPGVPPGVTFLCAGGLNNPANFNFDFGQIALANQKTESYAGFGQFIYHFNDKLSATFGIRYTYEKKALGVQSTRIESGLVSFPFQLVQDSWGQVTGRFGLDYKVNEDVLVYALASRGFKSGGFNGRPRLPSEFTSFNPETLNSYELGVKATFADGKLRTNLAVFRSDYKDLQLSRAISLPNGAPSLLVENAGSFRLTGIEFDAEARPVDGLVLSLGLGYVDDKLVSLAPGIRTPATPNALNRLPKMPKFTANVGVQYSIPVNDGVELTPRVDYVYRSKVYHETSNFEGTAQKGFGLVNARLTLTLPDGVSVGVYGTNLTDERYIIQGVQQAALSLRELQWGRPREFGITAGVTF